MRSAPAQTPLATRLAAVMHTWPAECGARLTALRVRRGWERSRLAAAAGTTPATIHRIESGAINPRDALRVAIADALGVRVEVIWSYPLLPPAGPLSGPRSDGASTDEAQPIGA